MNTKTVKAIDAIAVFAILAILGLATFASASSLQSSEKYQTRDTKYEVTKLAGSSDSEDSDRNETESPEENRTTSSGSSGGGYGGVNSRNELETSDSEGYVPRSTQSGGSWSYNSLVSVSVNPEKQSSKDGKGSYEVTIKDMHKMPDCVNDEVAPCSIAMYSYKLYFESKYGTDGEKKKILEGELEETEIELAPGEEKIVPLYVQTEFKGTHFFSITAEGSDTKNTARGLFIYDGEEEYPSPASYFEGEGFAINENQGFLVELNILNKDGTITGKANFENEPHKLSGTIKDNVITFKISSPNGEQTGNFEGTVTKYNDFLLLQGDLVLGTDALEVWKLTATSKLKRVFVEIEPTETSSGKVEEFQSTSINEIIAVQPQATGQGSISEVQSDKVEGTTEFYVKPTEIKEKKYFWIIPSGKQVLVVDVYGKDGQVTKKEIQEYGSTKVNDYSISVGSLENENSIQVSVKQAA